MWRRGKYFAITFTNKAAAEMRERLQGIIGPRCRGMWVSTFHSMCVRMLRADAERLGFSKSFTIYDTDDQKRLYKGNHGRTRHRPEALSRKRPHGTHLPGEKRAHCAG